MAINSKYLKADLLELTEPTADGELTRDTPTWYVKSIRLDRDDLKIYIEVDFKSPQGVSEMHDSRTIALDYTTLTAAQKNIVKGFYNQVEGYILNLPEFSNSTEI